MYEIWIDEFFSNNDKCIEADGRTIAVIDGNTGKMDILFHRFAIPERGILTYDMAHRIRKKRFPHHANHELPVAIKDVLRTGSRVYRLVGVDECGDEYTITKLRVDWDNFDNYEFFDTIVSKYSIPVEHCYYWEVEYNHY